MPRGNIKQSLERRPRPCPPKTLTLAGKERGDNRKKIRLAPPKAGHESIDCGSSTVALDCKKYASGRNAGQSEQEPPSLIVKQYCCHVMVFVPCRSVDC